MPVERRDFIKKSLTAALVLNVGGFSACKKAEDKLKILVLGGTYFVGPAIINAALQGNHSVTLFNRGVTNPGLFPGLRHIEGDRDKGVEAYTDLKNERWDVVIDVWPEKSNLVDEATQALTDHADHYIFISSIAVYADFQEVGLNEESGVVDLTLERNEWYYPEEKLAAENLVRERFKDRHTILRPGPITGWRDPAMDFLYWCIKLNRDDEIIAPGSGLDPLQFIDVKDVGRFAIEASEKNLTGTFNCVGPRKEALLWNEFLIYSKEHFGSQTKLIWANEDFLKANEVYSFSDLPLWAPLSEDRGFMQISSEKLIQTGFNFSPVSATLDDCLAWFNKSMDQNVRFGTAEYELGLDREKELRLIEMLGG